MNIYYQFFKSPDIHNVCQPPFQKRSMWNGQETLGVVPVQGRQKSSQRSGFYASFITTWYHSWRGGGLSFLCNSSALFESIQCLSRHEEAGSCGNFSFLEFRFQGMGWITTQILAQRRCRPQHVNKNTNGGVLRFSTHWQWLRSGLWRSSAICTLTVHPEIGIGKTF